MSTLDRLDAVSEVTFLAEKMMLILKGANVKNEKLISMVRKLRHEFAQHERELIHVLNKKGNRRHANDQSARQERSQEAQEEEQGPRFDELSPEAWSVLESIHGGPEEAEFSEPEGCESQAL